jgi:hypothetical protein
MRECYMDIRLGARKANDCCSGIEEIVVRTNENLCCATLPFYRGVGGVCETPLIVS